MYDKSKKTWSQRLKITKTTEINKSIETTKATDFKATTATTSIKPTENKAAATTTARRTTTTTKLSHDNAYNVNNFGHSQVQHFHTVAATMHLPTLQLSDYHISNGDSGGGVGGGSTSSHNVGGNGATAGYEYLPGALSRSMKYAEPWIYSTVRGIPARPSYHHFMPQAASSPIGSYAVQPLAVVICSCPEYLNGTKRDVKKASVCKKCKGSRLPLTPIGGTMRLPAGGMLAMSKLRSSGAATVRVASTTKKTRPTILDPQKDPYDLMRRTRLLSPEPGMSNGSSGGGRDVCSSRDKDKLRGRVKSESPVRGRSRKRGQLTTTPNTKSHISSTSLVEVNDSWMVEDADILLNASGAMASANVGEGGRRSILRCNVNPYDLISLNSASSSPSPTNSCAPPMATINPRHKLSTNKANSPSVSSKSQNEFMPPNDDFNVADAALTEEAPPFAFTNKPKIKQQHQTPRAATPTSKIESSKTMALRRDTRITANVNINEEVASSSLHDVEVRRSKRGYSNVQAIAGQRISLGTSKSTAKSLIEQSEDGRSYESIIVVTAEETTTTTTKTKTMIATTNAATTTARTNATKRATSKQPVVKKSVDDKQIKSLDTSTESISLASAQGPKRPPRIRKSKSNESTAEAESETEPQGMLSQSDNGKSAAAPTTLGGERVMLLTVTPTQHIKSILKRPSTTAAKADESGDTESMDVKDQQTSVSSTSRTSDGGKIATPTNQRKTNSKQQQYNATNSPTTPTTPTTKSQFYIPLPQARKKVQFRVEERIVHALESDATSSDEAIEAADETAKLLSDDEDDDNKALDDDNRQALKSKSNYEYYKRKREQHLIGRLESVGEAETAESKVSEGIRGSEETSTTEAKATMSITLLPTQNTLLADLQKYSDLMSQVIAQASSSSHNNSNSNTYNLADAAAYEMRATHSNPTTKSTHYEDISPIIIDNNINNNNNISQQHCGKSLTSSSNKIMSLGSMKMLLNQQNSGRSAHSSTSIKAINATTAPSSSSSTSLMPTTVTYSQSVDIVNAAIATKETAAPLSLVIRDDKNWNDNDDDDKCGKGDHNVNAGGQINSSGNNNNNINTTTENSNDDDDADVYEDANDNNSYSTNMNSSASLNAHVVTNTAVATDDVLKAKLGVVAATQNSQPTKVAPNEGNAKRREGEQSIVVKNANNVKQPQATQSRNPIRRSQSERHSRTTGVVVGVEATATAATIMRGNSNNNADSENENNNTNNNNINKNGHHLEDHTTNGDLRFMAGASAGSSQHGSNKNNNNNSSSSSRKNDCHREQAILSFKDTMALRVKLHRNDSRDIFARPREPPPPPPTHNTTNNTATLTQKHISADAGAKMVSSAALQTTSTATNTNTNGNNGNATKDTPAVALRLAAACASPSSTIDVPSTMGEKNSQTTKVSTNRLEAQQQIDKEAEGGAGDGIGAEVKSQTQVTATGRHTDSAQCGMQQMATKNVQETKTKQEPQQQYPYNVWESTTCAITTSTPKTTIKSLSSSPSSSTSSNVHVKINTSPSPQQQQRTIVRVAPFNKTKTTSEVHRLKISHTDNNDKSGNNKADNDDFYTSQLQSAHHTSHKSSPTSSHYSFHYNDVNGSTFDGGATADHTSSMSQKKTSILINGDDCYSTMNLSCDDASTPLYQSSVVVTDWSAKKAEVDATNGVGNSYGEHKVTTTANTVTINVSRPRSAAEELIFQHNKINTMLSRQTATGDGVIGSKTVPSGSGRAIIPIKGSAEVNLQRSASSTSSTSTSSMTSISSNGSGAGSKRGRTLIKLDYEKEKSTVLPQEEHPASTCIKPSIDDASSNAEAIELLAHEEELLKILRNPVEAVKRNLVPHVCGRGEAASKQDIVRNRKMKDMSKKDLVRQDSKSSCNGKYKKPETVTISESSEEFAASATTAAKTSFITKLLEDPILSQVADGLETETVAELIENSLKRLQEARCAVDMSGTKDSDDMNRLINLSLQKIKEERQSTMNTSSVTSAGNADISVNATNSTGTTTSNVTSTATTSNASTFTNAIHTHLTVPTKDEDGLSNRGSISSANSFASAHNNYELFDFDANESDCYQSCSSEITSPGDDDLSSTNTRSKFYQMLVDATLAEIEMSSNIEEDNGSHHYESIRNNGDPIYEEINDVPPPLPLSAPPINDGDLDKKAARSIFEGASKYDILSYLVDAKERGVVREEASDYPPNSSNPIIIEEEACDTLSELGKRHSMRNMSSRVSGLSDSSEDALSMMSSLSPPTHNFLSGNGHQPNLLQRNKGASSDIERNDSGVGSETSKSSRSKYQNPLPTVTAQLLSKDSPIHLCEDCDGPVETQVTESGIMFAPLVCRKCSKKRVERKEIITEIVETEEKYGRDLQIILEEFYHPMLVAGLLTQEQLSAIFLNTEELLENNQTLAERMRDTLDIALEQGDDDLLTVNIGKIFLDFTQMLHAFESYCVRQASASLLLANLEKEKELLRIFLKVSQMENVVLRRMNLNSFLMVPVQRVTKYPLLLARLYKVTPAHLEGRDQLKHAQEKIELHLNHINQEAKDVPTKLWRRISSSSPNRRASCEIDMINIKLRKMAIDILEWNHDEVRFVMEGKLLYTQPTDSNWKKARTIKLTPVNALLVTNGKPSANYKAEKVMSDKLNFPKHTGIREASLLVVKEKCGRYTLIREPLYLDRCIVCSEADWDEYFEVQEISSKDTFIFKGEDGIRTKQWYTQLQYHAQGMGAWRKRRNALANIMINGMLTRT